MIVKLLTEHHLEFEAAQARLSLHISKCHIVGKLMPRLNYITIPCQTLLLIQSSLCRWQTGLSLSFLRSCRGTEHKLI